MTDSVERTTPRVNNDVLATIRLGPLPEIATTSDFASCWKVPAVVIAAGGPDPSANGHDRRYSCRTTGETRVIRVDLGSVPRRCVGKGVSDSARRGLAAGL
jgi:hypothetical protein